MGKFKYIININDITLIAEPMDLQTIDSVIALVEANTINVDNFERLFGKEGEPEFEKSGALLETSTEQLYAVLDNPEAYLSVVVKDSNNIIIGFVNVQLKDIDGFERSINNFNFKEGFELKGDEWKKEIAAGKMSYKGDIVINKSNPHSAAFFILLYVISKELYEIGKTKCVTEIFGITKYKYNGEVTDLNIYNRRSFEAQVLGAGAYYVADGSKSIINKDDKLAIEYYPKILEHDLLKLFEICKSALSKKNIIVQKK